MGKLFVLADFFEINVGHFFISRPGIGRCARISTTGSLAGVVHFFAGR